jgi:linoleoyl-CoA desaturase
MTETSLQPRVRFARDDGFHAGLKRDVAAHLARAGRARWGDARMHAKTALILGWFAGSYALLLTLGASSPWLAAGLTVSLALATAGIGFSVMHDANHGAYSRSPAVNRALGLTLDLVGASSCVWRHKHNVQHHTYANIDGLDADVDAGPFLRLAPSQRRLPLHRFQHLYAWFLYGVLALKWWFVDDAMDLARGRIGTTAFRRPRAELVTALLGKAVFVGWTLVVPALVFRTPWTLVYFVLGSGLLGLVLSVVFQLAHTVPGARYLAAAPGEQRLSTGWAEHQVWTTADFAPRNRLLSWYVGGLNFQVEHHLFPDVCHVHYPALAAIVAGACRARGLPYRVHPSLRAAVAEHYRHLRALARAGEEVAPAASPA